MNSITASATAPRGGIALCVALLAVLAGTLAPAAEAYVGPGAGFALVAGHRAVFFQAYFYRYFCVFYATVSRQKRQVLITFVRNEQSCVLRTEGLRQGNRKG